MGPRNNHCNGKTYHHKFAVNVQTGWHASKAYSSTSLLFSHGTGKKLRTEIEQLSLLALVQI